MTTDNPNETTTPQPFDSVALWIEENEKEAAIAREREKNSDPEADIWVSDPHEDQREGLVDPHEAAG